MSNQAMEQRRRNLVKLAIVWNNIFEILLLTNLTPNEFITVAFENFKHAHRNSLSGKHCPNDCALTLFHNMPK